MVIAFWGVLSLSRVLWKPAYSRFNMKPKSMPKQTRTWIEALFCWFHVLWQHFMFLSFCMRFLPFSFYYPLICLHFPSFSFHMFSNEHLCPFRFLSCAYVYIYIYICIYICMQIPCIFVFMSFHVLSKVLETALWLGQGAECNQ